MINLKQSKLIISTGMFISLFISGYILFLQNPAYSESLYVRILFYSALLLYQARYFYLINFVKKQRVTFQLIEKQKNPILLDTFVGLFLFGAMPVILAFVNKTFNTYFNWIDILAVFIYLFGSIITLLSEAQRRKWKIKHAHSLYKDGLFKYANHINYFGETLSFPAYCWLATGSIIVFLLVMAHQLIDFAFIQIPKQEKYIKEKYPTDFSKIRHRKKFIPFIY